MRNSSMKYVIWNIYDGYLTPCDSKNMYTDRIKEAMMFNTSDEAEEWRNFITDRTVTIYEEIGECDIIESEMEID